MNKIIKHMIAHDLSMLPTFPLLLDGKFHRFKTNSTGEDGWYIGTSLKINNEEYIRLSYGDWSKNISQTYFSHKEKVISSDIKNILTLKSKEIEKKINVEKSIKQQSEYKKMLLCWEKANYCIKNDWMLKKKLHPNKNIRSIDKTLLVPVYNSENKILTLQRIYNNGSKLFWPNLSYKEGFFKIGDKNSSIIYITESIGNTLTLYQVVYNALIFCSFTAQNLLFITKHVKNNYNSKIVIVADNDGNNGIGQKIAYQCLKFNKEIRVVIPKMNNFDKCDISDIYINKGPSEVIEQLKEKRNTNVSDVNDINAQNNNDGPEIFDITSKSYGVISYIYDYYNITSYQYQPGFALQTALAFCSVLLGRKFRSNFNHYSSLYFLNIGKSGAGKEHQLTVIQELLYYVKKENLLGSSGYTSPGAITTALMRSPSHITLIDEFGDYLISLKDKNTQQRLVNKCILQLFNRCHSSYIGDQYSKFSRIKNEDDRIIIKNPALTLLAAVQPNKFYSNINTGLISDGFLGRFLIFESFQDPQPLILEDKKQKNTSKLLEFIKKWVDTIYKRLYGSNSFIIDPGYAVSPRFKELSFKKEAIVRFNEYSKFLNNKIMPKLEQYNASELVIRWSYMVGAISLIIALARDPWTEYIDLIDMETSIHIVDNFGQKFIKNVIEKINSTQYEKDKNEFLKAIRSYGKEGISARDISRKKPFYRFPRRERYAILDDLIESELIYLNVIETNTNVKNIYVAQFDEDVD